MVDPVTAGIVVGFLADKVLGTALEKYTEGAVEKINGLLGKVWDKLRGNPKAEIALQALERQDLSVKTRLETYLLDAMEDDPAFKDEIEALVGEIESGKRQSADGNTMILSGQGSKGAIGNNNQIAETITNTTNYNGVMPAD
ncbi:hypothetical protein [Spirulina major]|uniref:hypothetical protein n=1 Tax=Spirulina major TaxID=270636 RepID=UPI001114FD5B|nr:hypothetical protein [Spirulina major]